MKKMLSLLTATALISFIPITHAAPTTQEKNKETVVKFYELALNQKDFNAAAKYLGQQYIQHNPHAADGAEGFKGFIEFLRKNYPQSHSDIKQVIAQGNYVVLHVHAILEPGTRGSAIFDLFRLENGKIVEHWDTVQDIPAKPANTNGMF